ncbi:hypothetical protein SAMN05216436_10512 [bacterium A37T11]|nr:hypothetical protein SAMN05216436_10512 [bacterium A37T11]
MRFLCRFIGAIMCIPSFSAFGQTDSIAGAYNGSKPELASQLYLTPHHEFALSMSYGAIDNLILGTWEAQGKKIVLKQHMPTSQSCFLVYEGKSEKPDVTFTFNEFGQNTNIAFRILDHYQPDSMQYLYLPGESSLSHRNTIKAPFNSPRTFYLSRTIGPNKQEVYAFKLNTECNEAFLYYQDEPVSTPFNLTAEISDGKLYTIDDSGQKTLFGYREALPDNYKEQIQKAKKSLEAPDTLGSDVTGITGQIQQLLPLHKFIINALVKSKNPYFKGTDEEIETSSPSEW